MKISKTSLAIERHNLKNILVRLKAQDSLVSWLQTKIEHLQRDNHENIIEEIQKWSLLHDKLVNHKVLAGLF